MAITIDWPTSVISVNKIDMTLVQSSPIEIYALDLNVFRLALKDLEDTTEGMSYPTTHENNPPLAVGGVELARVINLLSPYTVTFEDGGYAINLTGANSNVGDRVNVNNVSVRSNNSVGLVTSQAVEYGEYGGGVTVDVTSPNTGTIYPTGTNRKPVNNIPDAVAIALFKGFPNVFVIGDLTLGIGDDVRGYHLIGTTHINSTIVVNTEALCLKTRFSSFDITGFLDGESEIRDCIVRDLEYFNGHIHDSYLAGTIRLRGTKQANISNCSILDVYDPPIIDAGGAGQDLMMPNFSGRLTLSNLSGNSQLGIGIDAGEITIDNTCTSGIVAVSGSGQVVDNSGIGCYVVDTAIDGSDVNNIQYLIEGKRKHHSGFGDIYFWDPINGNDAFDGKHPQRATNSFAQCHSLVTDNNHDVIIALAGSMVGSTITNEQVVISKNYVFLRGPGRDFTIHCDIDTEPTIDMQGNGCEVSGMQVSTNTTNTNTTILCTGDFPLIEDIYIADSGNGITVQNGAFGEIKNVRVGHNNGYAIQIGGSSEHFKISNSHIGSNQGDGININLSTGHEISISDTIIHNNTGYGINISPTSGNTQILGDCDIIDNIMGQVNDLGTGTIDLSNNSSKVKDLVIFDPSTDVVLTDNTAISSAVWAETVRTLTQTLGLTSAQETELFSINPNVESNARRIKNTIVSSN